MVHHDEVTLLDILLKYLMSKTDIRAIATFSKLFWQRLISEQ